MRLPYSLSRLRPASVALALVLLFALAGLFAVDRTIDASNRNRVTIESVQSAAIVESFLAVHAEALQSMRGLFLDTSRAPDSAHFRSLALSLSEYAASFQRIWISDASGRITNEHVFGDQQQRLGPGFEVDTAQAFSLARITHDARVRHRAQVSPPDVLLSGRRGILLIDPIYVGEEFRGFAGGGVTADAIIERLRRGRPMLRGRVLIVADADTIARTGPEARAFEGVSTAITTFNVPGGDEWQLIVERPSTYVDVRILLWAVGLATLGVGSEAADRFFDFHVADIAMGSGHFLVAAIDHLERGLSGYLAKRTLPDPMSSSVSIVMWWSAGSGTSTRASV